MPRSSKFTPAALKKASDLWQKNWSMQEIADKLSELYGKEFHPQNIQYVAAQNRDFFPKRDRATINDMISEGISRAYAEGRHPIRGVAAKKTVDRDQGRVPSHAVGEGLVLDGW